MSNRRFTYVLFLLFTACTSLSLSKPASVFAQDEEVPEPAMIGGSGVTSWILKGNKIYYLKWDREFEQAQIYGPQEIGGEDIKEVLLMQSTGDFAWILRGDDVYFVAAKREGTFVRLEAERPEELPDSDTGSEPIMMAGGGSRAWVLKGDSLFYLKWDPTYGNVQIYGPEDLPPNTYGPTEPVLMHGTGSSVWVLRGNEVFYVMARVDGTFVDIEIERPEDLPE